MARNIQIIQLGVGGVGQILAQQVLHQRPILAARYDITLDYLALVDRVGALATGYTLKQAMVMAALTAKQSRQALATIDGGRTLEDWRSLLPNTPCIIVDVTAADGMAASLADAIAAGHRVVLANKRPLTDTFETFTALTAHGATRYEATVGAGLPIISTLRSLLDSGDTFVRAEASMSGTLGYLCSALEEGVPLSQAVQTAKSQGWTEPDPRDDLSGADVARKALILARTAGLPWSMDDVSSEPWFPPELATVSVAEFMNRLPDLDQRFADWITQAQAQQTALRYVATIESERAGVGLRRLPLSHPLAGLRGPDNLFTFTTARYADQPLVVRGPGAGVEVTAAGVLGDIIATAREMTHS